jgi:enoyl-CoA hydratase/carnithine racemase
VTSETVTVSLDGPVAVVSLNRPDRHNAFNDEMDVAFFDSLQELAGRSDLRAVVWRGEGKSFSSGRDVAELGQRASGQSDFEFIAEGHARTRLLYTFPVPIVVALKGWVLGGSFERALLCDLRVASEDARMGLPEVQHGVIPDSGGVARLFQMAGHGVAADLALTGRVIGADEAIRYGIVSRVVANEKLDEAALEVARGIASLSPLAVRSARGVLGSLATDEVERGMHEELLAQSLLFGSEDYAELKAAKAEGREPKFRGR